MQSDRVESTGGPDSMEWLTLGHKILPIRLFRWPIYNGFSVWFRDWYFGPWIAVSLGWWCVQIGSGSYD